MGWWTGGVLFHGKLCYRHSIYALLMFLITVVSVHHINLKCMKGQDLKRQLSANWWLEVSYLIKIARKISNLLLWKGF